MDTMFHKIDKIKSSKNVAIKKIGNSRGIVIPNYVLKALEISDLDMLDLRIEHNEIILSKKELFEPKSLSELFKDYQGDYEGSLVFSDDVGEEVW